MMNPKLFALILYDLVGTMFGNFIGMKLLLKDLWIDLTNALGGTDNQAARIASTTILTTTGFIVSELFEGIALTIWLLNTNDDDDDDNIQSSHSSVRNKINWLFIASTTSIISYSLFTPVVATKWDDITDAMGQNSFNNFFTFLLLIGGSMFAKGIFFYLALKISGKIDNTMTNTINHFFPPIENISQHDQLSLNDIEMQNIDHEETAENNNQEEEENEIPRPYNPSVLQV